MDTSLPIHAKKDEIVDAVRNNGTVIVTAETGSGKSTQVPQYLMEAGFRVACTQPRRIACVNLAMRVREEIGAEGGDPRVVGYQTALEEDVFPETEILYCTDGLKLAQGIRDDGTVLVIDEVHEWNLNIEMLVAWVRRHKKSGGRIRTVIMSATMDVDAFMGFFGGDAVHVHACGSPFKVTRHEHREPDGWIGLVPRLVRAKRNILVFRPGRREIEDAMSAIVESLEIKGLRAVVLPLYGDLTLDEQRACFASYDLPKVVVATNIAQTSVTIPDIHVVIDDGMAKCMKVHDGVETLIPYHVSKADVVQRAGRAGRVCDGDYHLFSPVPYDRRDDWTEPEIRRLFLDQIVLRLAAAGYDAEDVRFFHQPNKGDIHAAKRTLRLLGAMDSDGITELGRRLAAYPVSVRLALVLETARREGILGSMIPAVAVIEGGFIGHCGSPEDSRSDILAQMETFRSLRHLSEKELPKGINGKAFTRIGDYVRRLSREAGKDEFDKSSPEFYVKFLKCLCAGYPEHIFHKELIEPSYDEFWNFDDFDDSWLHCDLYGYGHEISRNSVCQAGTWILGFPKRIVLKGRYGGMHAVEFLENVSSVPAREVRNILDPSHVRTRDEICHHSPVSKVVVAIRERWYLGRLRLGREILNFAEGTPEYGTYRKLLADCPEGNRPVVAVSGNRPGNADDFPGDGEPFLALGGDHSFFVKVGDAEFQVEHGKLRATREKRYFIPIPVREDVPDIPEFLMPDGRPLLLKCGSFIAEGSGNLKRVVDDAIAESKRNDPRRLVGLDVVDAKDFFDRIKPHLGGYLLMDKEARKTEIFLGLRHDGKKIRVASFPSEPESEDGTKKCVKALLRRRAEKKGAPTHGDRQSRLWTWTDKVAEVGHSKDLEWVDLMFDIIIMKCRLGHKNPKKSSLRWLLKAPKETLSDMLERLSLGLSD